MPTADYTSPANAHTYGDLGSRLGAYAEIKLLEHAEPHIILGKIGMHQPMPRNTGETIKWRRPDILPLATTPLTEGETPTATAFSYTDVQATLAEYGSWMPLTNKVADLHEDPVATHMVMMAGEQAADTVEAITYGIVKAGTNVGFSNGAARNAVNTAITIGAIRKAVRSLRGNKGKPITSILDGTPKYGTQPIEAGFIAVCHTDVTASLRKISGFVPVAEYGSRTMISPYEVGSVEDVRFIASPNFTPFADAGGAKGTMLSTGGTSADVYPVLIFAQDAFGCVALKGSQAYGGAIKPKLRQPGKADSFDPMGRNGSVAWNCWYTAKVLNDAWMYRLEVAAEENP